MRFRLVPGALAAFPLPSVRVIVERSGLFRQSLPLTDEEDRNGPRQVDCQLCVELIRFHASSSLTVSIAHFVAKLSHTLYDTLTIPTYRLE